MRFQRVSLLWGTVDQPFQWDVLKEQAAVMVASGEHLDEEIAATLDINLSTLQGWRANKIFWGRVQETIREFRVAIREHGIAIMENRLNRMNNDWLQIQEIIHARAQDNAARHPTVPGADTGLLVRETRAVGSGANQVVEDYWRLDTASLKELREMEVQAAKEMGQWTEKHDLTSGGQVINTVGYVVTPPAVEQPTDEQLSFEDNTSPEPESTDE